MTAWTYAARSALVVLCTAFSVVACDDLYGGSYRLFNRVFAQFGMEFSFVDMAQVSALEQSISPFDI